MSIIVNNNAAHAKACNDSESVRQSAVTAAILAGGGSATVQAAIKTAEIAHYRTCVASAVTNSVQSGVFRQALRENGLWA